MRIIKTFIIFLFPLVLSAQIKPIDTIPKYDFMFILTSERDFNVAERLIYHALVKYDSLGGNEWCDIKKDIFGKYMGECPTADRIMKIKDITPIFPYLYEAEKNPQNLEYYKSQMIATDIPDDWKWLISKLYIVNRKDFK